MQTRKGRGTATVLALLVSFLLGSAPAAAQAGFDQNSRLSPTELAKRGTTTRHAPRAEADDPGPDVALLPPQPRVRTEAGATRPSAGFLPIFRDGQAGERLLAYRARAPPAA